MRAAGLEPTIRAGGLTEREGADAARALLDCGDSMPTAIFAFNDRCALGVLDVLVRGRIDVPGRMPGGSRNDCRRTETEGAAAVEHFAGRRGQQRPKRVLVRMCHFLTSSVPGAVVADVLAEISTTVRKWCN
jgi:hypothetical protein